MWIDHLALGNNADNPPGNATLPRSRAGGCLWKETTAKNIADIWSNLARKCKKREKTKIRQKDRNKCRQSLRKRYFTKKQGRGMFVKRNNNKNKITITTTTTSAYLKFIQLAYNDQSDWATKKCKSKTQPREQLGRFGIQQRYFSMSTVQYRKIAKKHIIKRICKETRLQRLEPGFQICKSRKSLQILNILSFALCGKTFGAGF